MGWIGTIVGGVVGTATLPSQLEAINQQNQATKEGYKATDEAITFTQAINRGKADAAASEIARTTTGEIDSQKLEQAKAFSTQTVKRGEGVTAGYSLARELQVMTQAQQKQLLKTEQEGVSAISKMYQQMETDNFALQQEKRAAYNQANGQLISREQATGVLMQSVGSSWGG